MLSTMLAAVLVSFQNCSPVGHAGREPAEVQQNSNGGTTTDNPKATLDVSFMPHSVAAIQSATVCVEDVKFKRVGMQTQSSSAAKAMKNAAKAAAKQLRGRDIAIVKEGTYVDSFAIPGGDFNVVELVLDDDCAADKSITLQNASGYLSTKEKITLRFDGEPRAGSAGAIQLNVQSILEVLAPARSNGELKRLIENVRGTFH